MFRTSSPAALARGALLVSAAVLVSPFDATAQSEPSQLPAVTITAPEQKRAATRPPHRAVRSGRTVRQARVPAAVAPVPRRPGGGVRGAWRC
jgi:iron complex outermembrane receptor protein